MREVINKTGIIADNIFPLVAKSAEGMWNPSYGIKNLGPFDGSCLPKDAQAFLTWAKWNGIDVSLLETTIKINQSLGQRVDQEATLEEETLGDGLVASSTELSDIQNG
ncbi:MAG: hypothetical protein A2Z11_04575 [Candidatus Woykebacteria bacterium RBG_16_43_9]|uniref:UDP-glucose/GDP-mannose dehydrogenase dimerisation domain-containing protein n=1 Tax=Candidatus Woykebacteria bacterium RBG_16_43_9 TaxID=1802596 RepID=A0A1G1WCR8_9BACT|nr:MAG: hypothetical protein A2Z11_04575 [Candidatus Woykebacteria bacterium RBG_16_43_9]